MRSRFPAHAQRFFQLRLFLEGIAVGLAAGLAVALYRFLILEAETGRERLYERVLCPAVSEGNFLPVLAWLLALLLLAFLLARLCRFEPMAKGSGIPQVKGSLRGLMKLSSLRILFVQILGGALAIGAGLSLGHAGPAVEIGAAAGAGLSRAAGHRTFEHRQILAGGAAAGLAAVFNAPLTGMVFAVEELRHHFSPASLLPSMASAISAAFLIRFLFGAETVFTFPGLLPIPLAHLPYLLLLAVVTGSAAAMFNRSILGIRHFYALPCFHSHWQKIFFALLLAAFLGFSSPLLLGGGDVLIARLREIPPVPFFLFLLLAGKFLFTLLSFGCGVPGGFFFPSLVIGAMTGAVSGSVLITTGLLSPEYMTNIITLTMTAFFSASVRAPITGTILLLEMTGSFPHLLPLALSSATAYITSTLLGAKPIYDALLEQALKK